MYAVGIAAATESTVCSVVRAWPISPSSAVDVLRLDRDDDDAGAADGRRVVGGGLDAVALAQLGEPLLLAGGDDDLGRVAPAGAEQAGEQGLADPPAAEDRDLALAHGQSLGGVRRRQRHQAAAEAGEEVDAREAGPLAVRLEQLGRLPALDRPAAQRPEKLDEAEVADETVLVAAEALEADDARPTTGRGRARARAGARPPRSAGRAAVRARGCGRGGRGPRRAARAARAAAARRARRRRASRSSAAR